jgi:hypothetical protein
MPRRSNLGQNFRWGYQDWHRASLSGYHCPYCRRGLLVLRPDLVNQCDTCNEVVVTEEQWRKRQGEFEALLDLAPHTTSGAH